MQDVERGTGLLTRREVADYVGVSTKTIARWTEKKWLPCIRIGRLVRYKPYDVRDLIKKLYNE